MTADHIVKEMENLPPGELVKVVRHVKELDKRRQLSGEELGELAQQFIDATDSAEVDRLRQALVKGFYGEAAN